MNSDAWIEEYLDHVCAPLVGLLPFPQRQELRAELRDHLQALVAAQEERGSSHDAAVVTALRQFGDPRRLACRWAREWSRESSPAPHRSAWSAIPAALACFGFASAIGLLLMLAEELRLVHGFTRALAWGFSLYLLPLLAGLTTGLAAPARHAMGAFFALAAIIPCLALVYLTNDIPTGLEPQVEACLELAWTQLFLWVPVGCGSAVLGGRLQNRLALRRRRWVLP
jgi:hypothetical protein